MSFWSDFKSFALKGSVVDLAVGVIIGGAFGKIVSAMVEDVIMPLVGVITGKGQMFTDKFIVLKPAKDGDVYKSLDEAKKAGANIFAYGHFIQTVVDFFIVALMIFLVIKLMSRLRAKEDKKAAAAPPTSTETLLTEIRDLLQKPGATATRIEP